LSTFSRSRFTQVGHEHRFPELQNIASVALLSS
jgi:hypothetical protein